MLALTAKVNEAEDVPKVNSIGDFEICREVKENRNPTGEFEIMTGSEIVKEVLMPWEVIFIRFRDESGELFFVFRSCCFSPAMHIINSVGGIW